MVYHYVVRYKALTHSLTHRVGVSLEGVHQHIRQHARTHTQSLPRDGISRAVGLESELKTWGEVLEEPGTWEGW